MAVNAIFGQVAQAQTIYNPISSQQNTTTPSPGSAPTPQIIPARVKKIILDNSDQEIFEEFGEWNGIGIIFWEPVEITYDAETEYVKENFALPIFPNIKQYPLLNEITYIIKLPSTNTATQAISNVYYYFPPLNIWNSQLHNALPENDNTENDTAQQADYESSFQGEVRRPEDNSTEINLGSTFTESNCIDVHPLLPYEGDIIYEGRFGSSIRFGATVNNSYIKNDWSDIGENGDPLTIIRNGQAEYSTDPWEPVLENINGDLSDIWLTSTQKLTKLTPASNITDSYAKSTPPDDPREYTKNQILLNSGRLVFNAKDDAIILGAKKTIHLTADDSVNLDGMNHIVLTAPTVYVGSSQGTLDVDLQSAVLGQNLNTVMTEIYSKFALLSSQFQGVVDSLQGPVAQAMGPISETFKNLSEYIQDAVDNKDLISENVRISKRK